MTLVPEVTEGPAIVATMAVKLAGGERKPGEALAPAPLLLALGPRGPQRLEGLERAGKLRVIDWPAVHAVWLEVEPIILERERALRQANDDAVTATARLAFRKIEADDLARREAEEESSRRRRERADESLRRETAKEEARERASRDVGEAERKEIADEIAIIQAERAGRPA